MNTGDLYIYKSKLSILVENGTIVPPYSRVNKYMNRFSNNPLYPEYIARGNFNPSNKVFEFNPKGLYLLCLTPLSDPVGVDLDTLRLSNVVWSSYYEDTHGYLWQIVNESDVNNLKIISEM